MENLWIVIPVGEREIYLEKILSLLSDFSGRIVFVNNNRDYTRHIGVHHIEDFENVNIYRWWNKGISYSKQNGARYVMVMNDDIDFDRNFISEIFDHLVKNNLAIVDTGNSENNGGAAWIMDLEYGLFANESFSWWYGDTELFDRARDIGKFNKLYPTNYFSHLEANNLMFLDQHLQDLARDDAGTYNRLTDLKNIYKKYSNVYGSGGGDKGTAHDYLGTYAKHLSARKNISLLEIGVFRGESIKMWNEYFSDSDVYGIDISLANVSYPDIRNIFECDATSASDVKNILGSLSFDYVIDDGSHLVQDQISSFEILFPLLKNDGIYFIEDILGDEPLLMLISYMEQNGHNYEVADTRRPETTYNDIILIIKKERK